MFRLSLFQNIALVILLFSIITYVLATVMESSQYDKQDAMYEYQNLMLHQIMIESWVPLMQNNTNQTDITESLKTQIKKDLGRLNMRCFIGLYYDQNENDILDFYEDSLIKKWDDTSLIINDLDETTPFDNNLYYSNNDSFYLVDSLLENNQKPLYMSYGDYALNNTPTTFVELPINKNYIFGFYFLMDYPLPSDVDWPKIILPIVIVLMLMVVFWIIASFLYPIKLMHRHVLNLKENKLKSTIPILSMNELGQLSIAINKMTQDIRLLVNQKQNLLLDVSHELKTPLTRLKLIVANSTIIENDKEALNKEINFLHAMITNMLLSDKLSTPYIEDLEKHEINTEDLLNDTLNMFYKIEDKIEIDNLLPNLSIKIDKYKMSLAIKNLIDNAIKYGISKKLIKLTVETKKHHIYFIVQDYGKGMTEKQTKEIIKPFYRGENATKTNKSGFGLGLSITKKIVEAHNGELLITSEASFGSSFTIKLPIKNEKY